MKLYAWYRFGALVLSLNLATFLALGVSIPSRFITFDSNNNIIAAKSSFNGTKNDFAVARYTSDGVLDVTFGGAAVLAASNVALTNGTSNTSFAGAVFPVAGIVTNNISVGDDVANSVIVDSSDKIVAAGSAADALGIRSFALVKYNTNGTLDTTFNPNAGSGISITSINGADSAIRGLVQDATSRLVVAGFTTQTDGSLIFAVGRYNADGTLDTTFSPNGLVSGVAVTQIGNGSALAHAVTIDTVGKIVAAGTFSANSFVIARYNTDGTLDTTFNPMGTQPGVVITSSVLGTLSGDSVIIDNNDKIVVSGVLTSPTGILSFITARYNDDGSLDTTLNPTGSISGVPGIVITTPPGITPTELTAGLDIDSSDNIIVSGYAKNITFENFASVVILNLVLIRYLSDGTLDPTFNTTGSVPGIVVTDVSIQVATQLGLDLTTALVDPVTTGQVGFTSDVPSDITTGVFLDDDGNIITGGFSNNGQINNDLVIGRYTTDGILDVTFNAAGPLPGITFNNLAFDTIFFTTPRGPSPVFVSAFTAGGAASGYLVPAQPIFQAIPPARIAFPENGTVVTTPVPTILGTALPAAAVSIFVNNMLMGTSVADADGRWFFRMTELPDNDYAIHTRVNDVVGNMSMPSNPIFFTIAAQAPAAPTILSPKLNTVFANRILEFEGAAQPNQQVTLYLNNKVLDRVLVEPSGRWFYRAKMPLGNGPYTLYVNATNAAGKIGRNSPTVSFAINTAFAQPPLIFSPAHNAVIATAQVLISGSSGPNLPIALVINKKPMARITSDSKGNWQYRTTPLADGSYSVAAQILDQYGRPAISSEQLYFKIFTQSEKTVNTPVGITNKNSISENSLTINGKATPSAVVTIYLDNQLFKQLKAETDGSWSTTITRSDQVGIGDHTVTVAEGDSKAASRSISALSFQFV